MRSAQQVARRAVVMTTLAFRASLEVTDHRRSEELSDRLLNWLEDEGIAGELDPIEREILQAPYRKLHKTQLTDATLAGEGACFFAWTIGLGDPLPNCESADPRPLVGTFGILRTTAAQIVDRACLKSDDELKSYCLELLQTLSTMRQRRLSDTAAQSIFRRIEDERMTKLGLSPTEDSYGRSVRFLNDASTEQLRLMAVPYFVRSLCVSWLLDNRSSFFAS
ncbi:MAG TPA: DUF4272 domain-containing protein [Pirellulales bacterium]|nr:DUF4272 domain-containing protein [Pirellulales bacterium]